jgi:hypothetical protein
LELLQEVWRSSAWPSAYQIKHGGMASARDAALLFVRAIARHGMEPIGQQVTRAMLCDQLGDIVAAEPAAVLAFDSQHIEPSDKAANCSVERTSHSKPLGSVWNEFCPLRVYIGFVPQCRQTTEVSMLVKTTLTVAIALALASAAMAARSGGNGRGGSREVATGAPASSGVNPAQHRALAAPKEPLITSNEGKCWGLDKSMIGGWNGCPRH